MLKKFALALAIPVLVTGFAAGAFAAPAGRSCQDEIAEVQAAWAKMAPMGMDQPSSGYQGTARSFEAAITQAKAACDKGDIAGVENNLNLVRRHLGLPEHVVADHVAPAR